MGRSIASLSLLLVATAALPAVGHAQAAEATPAQPAPPPAQPPAQQPPAPLPAPGATPEPAAEGPAANEPAPNVPWLARLTWDQQYGVNGLARDAQQTFDPMYLWWFVAEAGYLPDELTTLYVRQDFLIELTDSNTTTTGQELQLTDTVLEVWRTLLDARPFHPDQQFVLSARAGFELPLSRASQASEIVLGTRARAQVAYTWQRLLHGLRTRLWARYARRWGGFDAVQAAQAIPCRAAARDTTGLCTHLGRATVRDVFVVSADAELSFTRTWSAGVLVWLDWSLANRFDDATYVPTAGDPMTIEDTSATHARNRRIFDVWVGYRITDWFGARAHVMNTAADRAPDNDLRAPFNPIDTVFGLDLSVSFDGLYRAARGWSTQVDVRD